EQIKREERAGRGAMDGIALAQPALSLAAKIQSRAASAGIDLTSDAPADGAPSNGEDKSGRTVGERLWALVEEAGAIGIDAEAGLRRVALARLERVRDAET